MPDRKSFSGPLTGIVLYGCIVLAVCPGVTGCTHDVSSRHLPVPAMAENTGTGVILNETISVSQRSPRMVHIMSVPRRDQPRGEQEVPTPMQKEPSRTDGGRREEAPFDQAPGEERAAPLTATVSGGTEFPLTGQQTLRYESAPLPEENLLDQMDVYALSPHAANLALPRMVSREYVRLARRGAVHMPAPEEWQRIILKASALHGLDPKLVEAVIRVESNFDATAESPKGAQGPMQLMPGTQTYLGVADPFDAEANVTAGSDYLRRQLDRFGSLELALAAYNAGPGNVIRYGGIPPFPETQAYVARVLEFYRQ